MSAAPDSPFWDEAVALVTRYRATPPIWPSCTDANRLHEIVDALCDATGIGVQPILAEIDRRVQERTTE